MAFKGKKLKKIIAFVCSFLLTSIVGISAANISPELSISTNKDKYTSNEDIKVDVVFSNNTENDLTDIIITFDIPESLVLKEGSLNYESESLTKYDSASYGLTLIKESNSATTQPGTGDDDSDNKSDSEVSGGETNSNNSGNEENKSEIDIKTENPETTINENGNKKNKRC